jgi:hypothetical protein
MYITLNEISEESQIVGTKWNLADFQIFMKNKIDLFSNENFNENFKIDKRDFELFLKSRKWIDALDENPSFDDTLKLFNQYDDKNKLRDLFKTDFNFVDKSTHFNIGKKLWLEIEITDEYMSNMIFAQMYSSTTKKLPTDIYGNSTAMGYRILTISHTPNNLSEQEKQILAQASEIIKNKFI